jgi:hypothetical protein
MATIKSSAHQTPGLVIPTESLDAASQKINPSRPVYMLNLLRFREQADYSSTDSEEHKNLPTCSGREAFHQRYVPAFQKLVAEEGIENDLDGESPVLLWGKARATLLNSTPGKDADARSGGQWDDVAVIKYPSFDGLRKLLEGDKYKTLAAPHRIAALEARDLIAVQAYQ